MNLADRALKAALWWLRNDRSNPDLRATKVRIYESAWKHGYEAAVRDQRQKQERKPQ